MGKKRSHARAEGSTQISVSLPDWVLKEIDDAAAAEDRNRSNMIVKIFKDWLAEYKGEESKKNAPSSEAGATPAPGERIHYFPSPAPSDRLNIADEKPKPTRTPTR